MPLIDRDDLVPRKTPDPMASLFASNLLGVSKPEPADPTSGGFSKLIRNRKGKLVLVFTDAENEPDEDEEPEGDNFLRDLIATQHEREALRLARFAHMPGAQSVAELSNQEE